MSPSLKDIDQEGAVEWVNKLHGITGQLDIPLWLDTMTTPDLSVKFYANPDLKGREQVEPAFTAFFSALSGLQHEIQQTDWAPPRIYHQCRAHYTLKKTDGVGDVVSMDVQAVYHVRFDKDELRCYRMEVYGDPSELYRKMAVSG